MFVPFQPLLKPRVEVKAQQYPFYFSFEKEGKRYEYSI